MLLFDDLDDVGHGVAETDLVRMMTMMKVVRLMMVSPDWRWRSTFSPKSQTRRLAIGRNP
jgi:hypothetical protein